MFGTIVYLLFRKHHEKIAFIFCCALFAACGSGNNQGSETDSMNSITIPPHDNNAATNPSLADTGYGKSDSVTLHKTDSTNKNLL